MNFWPTQQSMGPADIPINSVRNTQHNGTFQHAIPMLVKTYRALLRTLKWLVLIKTKPMCPSHLIQSPVAFSTLSPLPMDLKLVHGSIQQLFSNFHEHMNHLRVQTNADCSSADVEWNSPLQVQKNFCCFRRDPGSTRFLPAQWSAPRFPASRKAAARMVPGKCCPPEEGPPGHD